MSIIKKQGFHFAMRNLDRTDRLILEILQQRARISISELQGLIIIIGSFTLYSIRLMEIRPSPFSIRMIRLSLVR